MINVLSKCAAVVILLLMSSLVAWGQDFPKAELAGGYAYVRVGGNDYNGFQSAATYNFNKWVGITGEIDGLYLDPNNQFFRGFAVILPLNAPFIKETLGTPRNIFTLMGGPKFTYRNKSRFTPFAQALIGARRVEQFRLTFLTVPKDTGGIILGSPKQQFDLNTRFENLANRSLAVDIGGGLDIRLNKHFSLRGQTDYLFLSNFKTSMFDFSTRRILDADTKVIVNKTQNAFKAGVGLVYTFGK